MQTGTIRRFAMALSMLAAACGSDEASLGNNNGGGGGSGAHAPVATALNLALDLAQEQVLAGQGAGTDDQGHGLTFAVATQPTHGHVQMEPDGRFHYAPRCGFTGSDTFTYAVHDGDTASAPAAVAVSVAGTIPTALVARQITAATEAEDRLRGPLARGKAGDWVLANDRIKVVIQGTGRQWGTINPYGGTIIDAAPRCSNNGVPLDHFEEHASGVNIETAPNPTLIEVVASPPANTVQIRARGPDDLLDFINGSSAIRNLGFDFPPSADDRDLPITIETLYTLEQGKPYVKVELTVALDAGQTQPLRFYLVEYLNGSGEVEVFQHGHGFGEVLAALPCNGAPALAGSRASNGAPGTIEPCSYVAYGGNDRGAGVSYGYLHEEENTSTVSVSGVTVPAFGMNVVTVFGTSEQPNGDQPNYTVFPPPAPPFRQTRYFAVGQGTVAQILDIRNDIYGIETGRLTGTVTSGGQPVADAEIAVLGQPYAPGPSKNVVNHYRTAADGAYSMTLPPGSYTVRVHKEGHPLPAGTSVNLAARQTVTQNLELPATASFAVVVADQDGRPIPAKVQLVGIDAAAADKANSATTPTGPSSSLVTNSGVFGDPEADGLPYGITFTEFVDKTGRSPVWLQPPGEYELVVSRGPRYSAHRERVTLLAGATLARLVRLALVVPTPGYVSGDFHVHSIDSPDSEVSHVERVATYLAEGTDFFTPSDHEMRVDFAPTLAAMQAGHLLGTAPSAEITTFDYGHFNSWPVTLDATKFGGGSTDWGGAAPPGEDFPSAGHYVLDPAALIAAAKADPKPNLVQINHISSHFGPEGLRIDTGVAPPLSAQSAASRRLDPSITNFFSDSFDALEVFISVDGRNESTAFPGQPYQHFFEENAGDWFNMLNQGIRRTAIADSDTHERRTTSLIGRTMIPSATEAPGELSALADTLAARIQQGYAIGTVGPFMTVSATAPSTGQSAGLGLGQSTLLRTSDGRVLVTVAVRSPVWAEYDKVEFYVNNRPVAYTMSHSAGSQKRYRVCPDYAFTKDHAQAERRLTVQTVTDRGDIPGAAHFESAVTLELTGLTQDTWIVAMVRGTDGVSKPMFPVVPNSIARTGNTSVDQLTDGNLGEKGMPALAFTNPLFVDVNGDGDFDAPGVGAATECPAP